MKHQLKDIWDNFVGGSLATCGCSITAALLFGVVYLLILLGNWLWTLNWFHSAVCATGEFIATNGNIFEYIFVGGFFLWLAICFGIFIVSVIRDGYNYAISRDCFAKTKRFFIKISKIISCIILICTLLFCIGKCASDNGYNGEDHIPSRYRG